MTQEEKAKAYDEAIEKAKAWCDCEHATTDDKILLKRIFPELKESEDERIRKELINFFSKGAECDSSTNGIKDRNIIAWLEKQGERKPWSKEDETGLGDALWAIQQARTIAKDENDMGNLWCAENWLKSIKDRVLPQPKWSEEDDEKINELCSFVYENYRAEEASDCITWLKSFKNRVLPQPKQEWGEEDEEHIESILKRLDGMCKKGATFTKTRFAVNQDMDWLKSLRPQITWKPSEEQIKVCKEVYADLLSARGFYIGTVNSELNRLEEELKKL